VGAVAAGVARQGYDLQRTRYNEKGWRATFLHDRDGTLAHERDRHRMGISTPWHATQRAAWEASRRPD
jgi:hypothetical protein